MNIKFTDEQDRVTVFGLFESGWQAETMNQVYVGNPKCFAKSRDEFIVYGSLKKTNLIQVCKALTEKKITPDQVKDAAYYGEPINI